MKPAQIKSALNKKIYLGGLLLGILLLGCNAVAGEYAAEASRSATSLRLRMLTEQYSGFLQASLARLSIQSFPSFNSQRLDQQIRLYQEYLSQAGPPDVLIIGSSRALQGVDPEVLKTTLAERGFRDVRVYNFSVNGATARVVNLMLQQVLSPRELPRVIIWADGSRAINSGRPDLTYNGIVASEGFRRLQQIEGSIFFTEPVVAVPVEEAAAQSNVTMSQAAAQTAEAATEEDGEQHQAGVAAVDRSLPQLPPIPPTQIAADLSALGFQSVAARYNPATYFRQFPRVPGRYDSNYSPWRLNGVQTQATVAIAQFARQHRIPLIFVSLPLSREHLADRFRHRSEQQFRQHMQRLANQNGFIFKDLSQRWAAQSNYFADPSHLNREGARAVARQLAIDPAMPWQRLLAIPFPVQR